jgi:hypothetical protein
MTAMVAQCTDDQVPECPVIDALFEMRPILDLAALRRLQRTGQGLPQITQT